jgi:prepilin-type N-terminal cleavage/methylation domain-containing protein
MDTLTTSTADGKPTPTRRPDAGFTLSEVVVAISLTGVLILSIVLAGWTLIRVSRVSDDQAAVEAVLGAAADELTQFGWQSCPEETLDYDIRVGESAYRIGWPTSAAVVADIEYWDITTKTWSQINPFVDTGTGNCGSVPTTAAASRMQRVTVRASAPGGTQSRELQVVVAEIRFLDEQDT